MAQRILIDTDPGLDDAVAILFALAHPGLDVLGLTTVGGNIGLDRTTRNALRLAALAGRADLPVHAGADAPLSRPTFPGEALHGADGLGGVALPEPVSAAGNDAVGWLAEAIEAQPGHVTLCALGPLTNVARLLAERPAAARGLAGIVAMGGALGAAGNAGRGRAEFNLAADPEAAGAVLSAGLDVTLVPLDVTRQVRATPSDTRRLNEAGAPVARAAGALIDAYFADRTAESRPLHDPLVPLFLLRPDLFGCEIRGLAVDASQDPGALVPGPDRVRVATSIAADAARAALIAGLAGQADRSLSTSATRNATPAGIAAPRKS